MRFFSRAAVKAPFFRTTERADGKRRLLLFSYFFAPINVVGSLRWQAMAEHLAKRGWVLDVVMVDPSKGSSVDPASVASIDRGRLAALPPGTSLYVVPDRESWGYSTQRRLWSAMRPLLRRANHARAREVMSGAPTLDAGRDGLRTGYLVRQHYSQFMRWAHEAANVGAAVARQHRPDAIVSSGPPHSAHEAARLVARQVHAPWIMDMRDPWGAEENMPHTLAGPTWMRLTRRYEARCIQQADKVVSNNESARQDLCVRYPAMNAKFATVLNGADPLAIPATTAKGSGQSRFTIRYAGNIYVGRDPGPLLEAVTRVVHDLGLTPDSFAVEFLGGGDLARDSVQWAAQQAGCTEFVTLLPARPRNEALAFLDGATMLVALPQYARLAIPAKVFEYVQFNAWLLVLAERDSATELLFRDTGADVVEPNDVGAIATRIRCRYEQFRGGVRPASLNADGRFDRSRQAAIMLDLLDESIGLRAGAVTTAAAPVG